MIKSLHVIDGKRRTGNKDAAEFLQGAVDLAKAGKIDIAVCLLVTTDGEIIDGWSTGDHAQPFLVIGAIESLKQDFIDLETDRRRDQ